MAFYLTFYLAFYLAYLLTFYLAYLLALYLAYLMAFYLAYLLAFYLTFYLAYLLAFYLPLRSSGAHWARKEGPRLRSSGAHWARQVPGWGPAVRTELGRSQVEVQRCALSWEGPRLRSSHAHWAPKLAKSLAKSWQGNSGRGSGGRGGRLRRGGGRGGGGRRRRRRSRRTRRRRRMRRTALIKSNNPLLAAGELANRTSEMHCWATFCIMRLCFSLQVPIYHHDSGAPTPSPMLSANCSSIIRSRFLSSPGMANEFR